MSERKWEGALALVTGASSGIGRAVAVRLAKEGMNVVAVARRTDKLNEMVERNDLKGSIKPFTCDITKGDDLDRLFAFVKDKFKCINILVNNAGIAHYTKVTDFSMEKWRHMFDLNVLAVGEVTKRALPILADDAHIINISSISAHGLPNIAGKHVYNASKHALRLITEGLRMELTDSNPRMKVTMISPGCVNTEIGDVGGWSKAFTPGTPTPPFLEAGDTAEVVYRVITLPNNILIPDVIVRPLGEKIPA